LRAWRTGKRPGKMRRIAFVAANEAAPWGGGEALWSGAAERLVRQGVEVRVSVLDWGAPVKQVERLRAAGCDVVWRPGLSVGGRIRRRLYPGRGFAWHHLRRVANGADLVVISQSGNTDGLVWMEAAREQGIPYATISQTCNEQWWPDDATAERLAAAYEAARAAYFVSEANLAMSRGQFGSALSCGRVIRNPFNVRYEAHPEWPGDASEELRLACVAALDVRQKGQNVLIEVLERPHWRDRRVRVTFAGSGPHERLLRKMVARAKLENVEFAGFVADIEALWGQNHALVMASRFEGMPLALVEAMLCARAAIVTDVGGNRELVRDGESGFLAKAATADLLDEAMNRAWEGRRRLREMGEAAVRDIREAVSPDPVGEFVRELERASEPDTFSDGGRRNP
jgi:glycosyltransferase involved in cell wall biosynthesis